jgi:DNA-binding GntR family transcriptional regulator
MLGGDTAAEPLAAPPHKTLGRWAVSQLRELIVSGRLPAGSRLFEADLAARMTISRTPVREAIRQLEQEGLVTVYPNRETVVTAFTADDVREIYQLRAAVEGMAAFIAAERREPTALAAMFDVLADMQARVASADEAAYFELDAAFHDQVLRASGNSRLLEVRLRMRDQTRRYLSLTLGHVSASGLQRNFHEHEAIGLAIREGDAERAEALMRSHVRSNGDRIARSLVGTPAAGSLTGRDEPSMTKEEHARPGRANDGVDSHRAPTPRSASSSGSEGDTTT